VDVLRRKLPGVPVVHEGKGGIVDNPVVTLLLALVRYAAHPGDLVALRHLQMSPLAGQPEMKDCAAVPGIFLAALHQRGFAGVLREWGDRLGALDAFGRQRLRELLAAAEQFDATGSRDPDAFEDHIRAYQVKASAAAGTVRVMTIHQAKGLGFDLVVVPFSAHAKSFERPGDPKILAGDDWVLDPPCAQALEAAAGAPLGALDAARAEANFAQLCVLYVALTRAQRALYMIIPAKAPTSTTVREADLLRERLSAGAAAGTGPGGLTQLFSSGDSAWFKPPGREAPPSLPEAANAAGHSLEADLTYAAEVRRREPSKEHAEGRAFPAQWLFGIEAGDVRAFGSAIHRLFQKIEWVEDADVRRVVAEWREEAPEPEAFLDDVERQFLACLANTDVRRHLARPSGPAQAEVWREAPFDLVLEAEGERHLMSGRFDRLVVERDATGRPVRATIFDFKSNRVETDADLNKAADGYARQMADYASAAAHLLGLQAGKVSTVLLFTRTGWIRAR
jgi:ATP-dependent helicase/nuclease subunit A